MYLLSDSDSGGFGDTWLLLLVVGALVFVMIVPRLRRKNKAAQSVRRGGSPSTTLSARKAADEVAVQLHEVGREMCAHLETKMKALEILIEDADGRIGELRLLAHGEQADKPAKPDEARARSAADGPLTPKHSRVYELADEGLNPLEIARRSGIQPGEVALILELRGKEKRDEK